MVSQEEFDQLRNSYTILARKVADMELSMSNHVGLDYGATGQNYPHPNQSVHTAEFGGALMRLGPSGMQVKAETDSSETQGVIYFVEDFFSDPDFTGSGPSAGTPYTSLSAWVNGPNDANFWLQTAENPSAGTGGYVRVIGRMEDASTSYVDLEVRTDTGAKSAGLSVFANANHQRVEVTGTLQLRSKTSDPASIDDGEFWYRSDTDKIKARINGVTENLATETYVTDNAGGSMKKVQGSGYQVMPAAAAGVDVTPGNSWANGSYVEVEDSTAAAVYLIGVKFQPSGHAEEGEFDIATGAAASETVISTVPFNGTASGASFPNLHYFYAPIAVATSTRIAIRARRAASSLTLNDVKLIYVNQSDLVDL